MENKQIVKMLEYIHFVLQECEKQLDDDVADIQNAIECVESIRENFWEE